MPDEPTPVATAAEQILVQDALARNLVRAIGREVIQPAADAYGDYALPYIVGSLRVVIDIIERHARDHNELPLPDWPDL